MQFAIIVAHFVLFALCICAVEGGRRRKWSKWTECDTHIATCPCGEGTQERTRRCRRREKCSGLKKEVKDCNIEDCKCAYDCNVNLRDRIECGPGNKTKEECPEDEFCCFDETMKTCYKAILRLVIKQVPGEWTAWSECICGVNLQTRSRGCTNATTTTTTTDARGDQLQDTMLERVSAETNLLGADIKKKVGLWHNYLTSLSYRKKTRGIEFKKEDAENEFNIDRRGWGWHWMRIPGEDCEPELVERPCKADESCKNENK